MLKQPRSAAKGKRGCRFGCFHLELVSDMDASGAEKVRIKCCKGWPRVPQARFAALPRSRDALPQQEASKNESPHVFQPQRDHPFEGMSSPIAQACMRCSVDVKYLGRALCSEDLEMLMAQAGRQQSKEEADESGAPPHRASENRDLDACSTS